MSEHNLKTSAGGRGYIADFFRKQMKRRDFDTYIRERLAADFACALAAHLEQKETDAQALREEVAALRARVVVVPERIASVPISYDTWDCGWNACLDELARLNGKAVSEGLLRRLAVHRPGYAADHYAAVEELRALLGEGKEVGDA